MKIVSYNKLSSPWSTLTILLLFMLSATTPTLAKQKDGKIAKALDEYRTTITCLVNIAEETLPELDDFMACCGYWTINDWLMTKVEDECESEVLQKMKNVNGLLEPHVRNHCTAYERGSFTCRLLVIMPITFVVLFILLILSISVCACVSLFKWVRVRRKYRRVMNIRQAGQQQAEDGLLMGNPEKMAHQPRRPLAQENKYETTNKKF